MHTQGEWFYDVRTESIGCPAGWIARIEHTQKGDGEFGNPDDDGRHAVRCVNLHDELIAAVQICHDALHDWKYCSNPRDLEYAHDKASTVLAKANPEGHDVDV